ncbi:hypothetical protein KEJ21_04390 [Candidatus Bathyarchaeota archaeon]|nr:hypothetical protein [Candidatus Bathyarchaeota archaeon]MBS7630349.1 hypothetical protein [Candidatus Bathyarchaeota archaeon]
MRKYERANPVIEKMKYKVGVLIASSLKALHPLNITWFMTEAATPVIIPPVMGVSHQKKLERFRLHQPL